VTLFEKPFKYELFEALVVANRSFEGLWVHAAIFSVPAGDELGRLAAKEAASGEDIGVAGVSGSASCSKWDTGAEGFAIDLDRIVPFAVGNRF
jgi:hypothetical protein